MNIGFIDVTKMSIGESEYAQYVNKVNQETKRYLHEIPSLSKEVVYDELRTIWEECKTANWDGNEALPVQEETNKNTYFFIQSLPLGYPLPSVGIEPDGHLTLEWHRDVRWTFSVSISPEGIIYYAALFDSETISGSEKFSGNISKPVLNLIQKVHTTHHDRL
jgi:hypothetical protein